MSRSVLRKRWHVDLVSDLTGNTYPRFERHWTRRAATRTAERRNAFEHDDGLRWEVVRR